MSDADLIELILECRRLRLERLLAVAQLLDLVDAVLDRGAFEALHALGDLLLLARHLLGLTLRVGDVARAAGALRLLQLALRVLQPLQRGRRLRRAHLTAVGGRLPHLIGRFAHPSRGIAQVRAVLLARQLLEPARRFLDLIGQLPLAVAAARAGLLPAPRAAAGARPPAPAGAPAPSASPPARRPSGPTAAAGRAARSRTGWPSCPSRARTSRPGPRPSDSARRRHRRRPAGAAC